MEEQFREKASFIPIQMSGTLQNPNLRQRSSPTDEHPERDRNTICGPGPIPESQAKGKMSAVDTEPVAIHESENDIIKHFPVIALNMGICQPYSYIKQGCFMKFKLKCN